MKEESRMLPTRPRVSSSGLALAARRLLPRPVRLIMVAGGLFVWLVDIVAQIHTFQPFFMADSLSYAAAGRHLLAGEPLYAIFQLNEPYRLAAASFGLGFVYPPTAALLFIPLAPLGIEGLGIVAGGLWLLFGFLVFRLARQSGLAAKPAAALTFALTFSGPAINAASSGNMNLAVADGLLASWLWPGSAGALAVVGGAIKIFPGTGLIWTVRRRESLVWPLALAAGLVIAATLLVGTPGWSDFVAAFGHGRSSSVYPSPSQLFGPGIGTALGCGLAVAACVGAWRLRDDAFAFVLLGWAMILPAPDWYPHYLLIPLAASLPCVARFLATRFGRPSAELDSPPAGRPTGPRTAAI